MRVVFRDEKSQVDLLILEHSSAADVIASVKESRLIFVQGNHYTFDHMIYCPKGVEGDNQEALFIYLKNRTHPDFRQ
jgi:hypothetical protein